jgi:7-dehydrocholesterol reductase
MPTSVRLRKENAESNIPNTNLKNDESKKTDWGRATKGGVSNFTVILCLSILLFCPLLVIYFWMACDRYDCSLSLPFQTLLKRGISWNSFKSVFLDAFPKPSTEGFLIFSSWVAFQGFLYAFV